MQQMYINFVSQNMDTPLDGNGHQDKSQLHPAYRAHLIHTYQHSAYPLLDEESLWIGRASDSDIVLREVFVSRKHLEIRPTGEKYEAHPVGSTPTLLNGVQINSPQTLREGDVLAIGTMKFIFTQKGLPVAMQQVDPWANPNKLYDEVSDRRPTLNFPIQHTSEKSGTNSPGMTTALMWAIALIVLAAIIGYMLFYSPTV